MRTVCEYVCVMHMPALHIMHKYVRMHTLFECAYVRTYIRICVCMSEYSIISNACVCHMRNMYMSYSYLHVVVYLCICRTL